MGGKEGLFSHGDGEFWEKEGKESQLPHFGCGKTCLRIQLKHI